MTDLITRLESHCPYDETTLRSQFNSERAICPCCHTEFDVPDSIAAVQATQEFAA